MRSLWLCLATALVLLASLFTTACGRGSGGSGDPDDARRVLGDVLIAAQEDAYARARPSIDVPEWLASLDHPQAAVFRDLPQATQHELGHTVFRQVRVHFEQCNLKGGVAIRAALDAGATESMPQLKTVTVRFSGPDAQKAGRMIRYEAKLRYGIDSQWRLVSLTTDL